MKAGWVKPVRVSAVRFHGLESGGGRCVQHLLPPLFVCCCPKITQQAAPRQAPKIVSSVDSSILRAIAPFWGVSVAWRAAATSLSIESEVPLASTSVSLDTEVKSLRCPCRLSENGYQMTPNGSESIGLTSQIHIDNQLRRGARLQQLLADRAILQPQPPRRFLRRQSLPQQ